jgi:hypothetical protein
MVVLSATTVQRVMLAIDLGWLCWLAVSARRTATT